MTVPRQAVASQIACELLAEDLSPGQIQLYSAQPRKTSAMPVDVTRYRSPTGSVMIGLAAGAVTGGLVGLPLLALGTLGIAPLLVLTVAAAVGGAIMRLWIGNGPNGALYHLDDALRKGKTVVVLEVEVARVPHIKQRVQSRHPEVWVTGRDSTALAPFR